MRNKIMVSYVAGNMILPVIYALVVILGIVTLNSFQVISRSLSNVQFSLWQLLLILILGIPANVVLASAGAVLFGFYTGLSNLSKNLEIVAFRSLGISITRLLIPAALIGCVFSLVIGFFSLYLSPYSLKKINEIELKLLQTSAEILIEPGEFNYIGDYIIYASGKDGEEYSDLFFTDKDQGEKKILVMAEKGSFYFSSKKRILVLNFQKGKMYRYSDDGEKMDIISFENFNFPLELKRGGFEYPSEAFGKNADVKALLKRDTVSLSFFELLKLMDYTKNLKDKKKLFYQYRAEFYNRFNYALFPLAFAFIALSSGVYHPRFPQKLVFVKLMGFVGMHYYLSGLFHRMSENATIHPVLMFILPVAWSVLGILLFFLKSYDLIKIRDLFSYFRNHLFKKSI